MFICVAMLATSVLFVSCKDEEDDPIKKATVTLEETSKVLPAGVTEYLVKGTITSETALVSVKIFKIVGETETDQTVTYTEVEDDTYAFEHLVTGIDADCVLKVVVANGADEDAEASVAITFTPKTELGEATTFAFVYQSQNHNLNVMTLPALGITASWSANPVGFSLAGSFVSLTAAEFNAIGFKEDLKDKFDAGTETTPLVIGVPSNEKMYFIAKNGENYFLVETTERYRGGENDVPRNRVTISYKQ